MQLPSFMMEKFQSLFKIAIACLLIFTFGINSFAQFKGAPVKKERLLKALRSKQLQTGDIVAVINSNGVDFKLTDDVRQALIAAGARPAIIQAVANNFRTQLDKGVLSAQNSIRNSATSDYNELLERAMFSYQEQKNSVQAVRYLQSAVKMKPNDSKAYQMLAFINLYGLNNLAVTQKYMRESMAKGGSAVFRVYHDDSGNFSHRCSGSLYVSSDKIRFESDDNIHTFETSIVNVEKIQTDTESAKGWKNHPIFNVHLKFGKEKAKFRFAPMTGKFEESAMAKVFISEQQPAEYREKSEGKSVFSKIKSIF